jgi:hypothetical protein
MKSTLPAKLASAAMLLVPLAAAVLAQPAAAQHDAYRVVPSDQGTIRNVSLNSDGGLRPGATLRVQVYGTPGARWANVMLGDALRVPLQERAPGEYVGTHVIARGEHIDPSRLMTVRAGWGEGPVALAFNFPPSFQALAMGAAPAVAETLVNSFAVSQTEDLEPGTVVHFRLEGTPRARASVDIPDVVAGLPLREVRPGFYVGSYTVRRSDDPDAFADARAVLRNGDQRAVARLGDTQERYGSGYGRR